MVSQSRRSLVDDLDPFDRLLEVGIGDRPGVAAALARRGRTVVAIDVSRPDVPRADVSGVDTGESDAPEVDARQADVSGVDTGESDAPEVDARQADVTALAAADDPVAALATAPFLAEADRDDGTAPVGRALPDGFDAVYACNLPAELQRATVTLADRLDATCRFTTLGFEEPIVPVTRHTLPDTTLCVARERNGTRAGDR